MVTDTIIKKGLPDETSVKAGYKQTEIGVIPEDWDVKEMEDFTISVASGKSNTTNELGDYPIYGSTGIIGYKKQSDYAGDKVLIARVGANAGTVNEVSGKYCVSDNTLMVTYQSGIDINFSYYQLINFKLKKLIFGSGQPLVTGSQIKKIAFALPKNKTEQSAIAIVLSDTDALIENVEKLIAKKKAIKQGAMQQLLAGKKRLPGFSGEWVVSPLGKLCNYQNGTALEKYFNKRNGLLVISIGNYSEAGKFVETSSYIDRKYFKELKKFVLNKNDLTMILNDKTAVGTIIGRVLYIEENEKYIFNQRTMRLTAKDEIEPLFLYFQINSSKTHKYIVNLSKPGTQIYVNTDDITELPIAFPKSKAEQTAIVSILSDMDAEIEKLEQKKDKYIMLKQGMMQQLLTGRIRIYANN